MCRSHEVALPRLGLSEGLRAAALQSSVPKGSLLLACKFPREPSPWIVAVSMPLAGLRVAVTFLIALDHTPPAT